MIDWALAHWAYLLLALIGVQRLAELALAQRNTARLIAQGALEHGAGHYPLFVILHGGWLAAMALTSAPAPPLHWPLALGFALLFAARFWVIASLGRYWTTRIITLPGAALVRCGPYRLIRHPNYLVVALEVPLVPLMLGLPGVALAFGVLNLLLLAWRIRTEEAALAPRRVMS